MHFVTKVQGSKSDGSLAALAEKPGVAATPKRMTRIIRDLVQGAWRRRLLILLPIILMLPISIAAAIVLPKAYMARSLMQLQEAGRENPFSREGDAGNVYRIQERFAGLQALFLSESVLGRALGEGAESLPPVEREGRIGELRQSLSFDLIGGDFIEVKLAGAKPDGLGKTLEAVMASFLEALVPEQRGATAAQLMVNARRQELDTLTRTREEVQRELATLLPKSSEEATRQQAALESARRDTEDRLTRTEAEISRLRSELGNPTDVQLEKDMAALPAQDPGQAGQPADSGHPANEKVQSLSALKSLLSLRQSLASQAQDLGSQAAQLDGGVARARELQDRIATLDKEIAAAQESYESYQKRFSGANSVRNVGLLKAPELIRIVDPPRDPATPSRSRIMYLLSGLAAGSLLGLALAFVAERLDQRIRHADEASEATGLPVLAEVRDKDDGRHNIEGGIVESRKPQHLSRAAG